MASGFLPRQAKKVSTFVNSRDSAVFGLVERIVAGALARAHSVDLEVKCHVPMPLYFRQLHCALQADDEAVVG